MVGVLPPPKGLGSSKQPKRTKEEAGSWAKQAKTHAQRRGKGHICRIKGEGEKYVALHVPKPGGLVDRQLAEPVSETLAAPRRKEKPCVD